MQRDWMARLKSGKFLMAVANVLFIIVNEVLQQPIDPDTYWLITGSVIAWILGESYVDGQHK